jgi:predicted acyltransferase
MPSVVIDNPKTATATQIERTMISPQRVLSVDVLRGITMAFMILVNDPGDWAHVFKQLDHAEWNGWTLTDLVFPTFLFLVGASLIFSLASREAKGNCRATITGHLFARCGKLLLLQFVLVYFPRMHWSGLRFYGVIPRIAICYLFAGLILLAVQGFHDLRRRTLALIAIVAALLLGYWILMRWVPVPGIGQPVRDVPLLDPDKNLASWIDRSMVHFTRHWLHTGVLYRKTRDPEGLLSTLPAIATTLLGSLTGMWMRAARGVRGSRPMLRMQGWLALIGVLCVIAGQTWNIWFPINKNLWTSSYVLLAAGWVALALAALSWLVDGRPDPWPRWLRFATWPWFVFGSNAIAAFTVSVVLVKGLLYYHVVDADGYRHSYWEWIYDHIFARTDSTYWTSLTFGLAFVAVCFLPNWWLWRKKWFLKV